MGETAYVPFPAPVYQIPRTSQFRSTWLSSSLRALRQRGLMDAYFAALPREYHAPVEECVAGAWLPAEVAEAHYRACDALGLSVATQMEIGASVAQFAQGSLLNTFIRMARSAGVTPWTMFGNYGRLWDRIWVGGAVAVYKLSEHEARVEIVQWTCAGSDYCRNALRGVLRGMTDIFGMQATVHELPRPYDVHSLAYRVRWASAR
jgi:hypothetical protein